LNLYYCAMYSVVEENYLKALFSLAGAEDEVSINELSKRLEIKMPTVNSMMKRFAEKELIVYESYKPVKITPKGRKEAALIVRKHRLTEMFLVEKMGFNWEEVHEIAEQIEHIKSPVFFDKMDTLLGHPRFDPHGSPIPDVHGNLTDTGFVSLTQCLPGEQVTLKAVLDSSEDFLRFLNGKFILLGDHIQILSIEEYDCSMELDFKNKSREKFSQPICSKLLVERRK
jgi:DtxR family Mn-dependent transcriptional regulator